jgi:hypothetical protein
MNNEDMIKQYEADIVFFKEKIKAAEDKIADLKKEKTFSFPDPKTCNHNWVLDGHNCGEAICSRCYKRPEEVK